MRETSQSLILTSKVKPWPTPKISIDGARNHIGINVSDLAFFDFDDRLKPCTSATCFLVPKKSYVKTKKKGL